MEENKYHRVQRHHYTILDTYTMEPTIKTTVFLCWSRESVQSGT